MAMDTLVIEAFTYLGVSLCIVSFRIFCRARQGCQNIKMDDYLMVVAMIPYIAETSLSYTVGMVYHGLANSAMTEQQRASLPPDSDEHKMRVGGSINQLVGWSLYTTVIFVVKTSMCAFYARLTEGIEGYTARIYVGYAVISLSYIGCMCCILFSCRPMHKLWQIHPDPGNLCQPAINRLNVYVSMASNSLTDIYLMIVPLPLLWGSNIPNVKKISLTVIFSGGLFVLAAGIIRCVLILQDDQKGPRSGATWAVRESFVCVLTTNLPMTWGFVRQKLHGLRRSPLSKKSHSRDEYEHERYRGSEASWRDKQTKTMVRSVGGSGHDMFMYTRDGSSDEIVRGAAPVGRIRKDVEFTLSCSEAPTSEKDSIDKDRIE